MKTWLSKCALALSLLTVTAPALAEAEFLLENDEGDSFYYDTEFAYEQDGITATVLVEHAEVSTSHNGYGYDVTVEEWTYDCNGMMRVDDIVYFFGEEPVDADLGIGEWDVVNEGTVGSDMQDIVCS